MSTSSTSPPQLPAFLRQSKSEVHAKFIDLEWQQRNRLLQGSQQPLNPSDPPSQWSRLTGDAVAARNRYLNVEPYAQNRIKLKVAEGVSDYINASPITLGRRRYVATQGPKDSSMGHFWRMVEEEVQDPVVVVMLTQTHESGREKCFQYYPLSAEESPMEVVEDEEEVQGEDAFKGELVLESVEEDERSRSEVRKLRLRVASATVKTSSEDNAKVENGEQDSKFKEKTIHHLLFSGWPDFLIPEGDDRAALIELIRLSAALNSPSSTNTDTNTAPQTNGSSSSSLAADLTSPSQSNPRIIHCSAGVGRSGTFIALDYLLSLLYAGELDDLPDDRDPVAETVDLLRQQRMMMVQGEAQFHFVYEVLREQMVMRMGGVHEGQNVSGAADAEGGAAAA